ncbi:putative ABC transporter permease protein YesQ [Paenibacillus hunanensis]|uniref:Multiple sugar transport system permease protein n=2 Tax=Paenibacillus hunanensis TaxID=539262 RepID=A0ABU1J656_9BACL|nr:multiple sugar transport system permease protein [Paenibacillus hunanensis]GGJ13840.1 putative ABC transporter permease protein YesQ [Paenibacillus hunanensis]
MDGPKAQQYSTIAGTGMQRGTLWRRVKWPLYHILVGALALLMLYPIIWMFFSSFKESRTIFTTATTLLPAEWIWTNYVTGWKGIGGYSFGHYIWNSLVIVVLSTLGVVLSSALIAFGFARLQFVGRTFWFGVMMVTLMLPHDVVLVPQYIIFTKLGWLNTIWPIVVPQFFGAPFFIFLMVQFIRTIPKELDEAATIDGCGKFRLFLQIIMPLIKASLATAAIFSFYWRWEDLLGPVLYLNSPDKYTVSMGLKMFLDSESASNWGGMFAMSMVSLLPVILVFFLFQKHIVEGISSSGIKG